MGGKASKKAYATGGTVDSGKPVAMTQGRKPVPAPVEISRLAGTYKNGGRATPAEARLLKNNAAENKTAMREAKNRQQSEVWVSQTDEWWRKQYTRLVQRCLR